MFPFGFGFPVGAWSTVELTGACESTGPPLELVTVQACLLCHQGPGLPFTGLWDSPGHPADGTVCRGPTS